MTAETSPECDAVNPELCACTAAARAAMATQATPDMELTAETTPAIAPDLASLAEALVITEERRRELDMSRKRLVVDHSLVLHRASASADDIRAMLDALTAAGMPGTATVRIDSANDHHTRIRARWHTEPIGGETR